MEQLLIAKQQITRFYSKFEAYIVPVLRFLTMLFALIFINANVGYMSKLKNPAIVLILSLLCSFLPTNVIVVLCGLIIAGHVYSLSMNCAVILVMVMMIMYALYFRFTPKDAVAVILTPIAFVMHIPYAMPIIMGLTGTPLSALSVGCGTAIYYMLEYVKGHEDALSSAATDTESALSSFKGIIDGLIKNETMVLMIIAFAITITVVYLLRRLKINYSWQIAIGTGIVLDMLVLLIGTAALDADVSVIGVILGSLAAAVIAIILQFFVFNVDYSRAEYVQFEDDEYYYYVKAVPKITLEAPNYGPRNARGPQRGRDLDEDFDEYYD